MNIKTIVLIYIIFEVLLLGLHYLFICLGNDLFFGSLENTIIAIIVIGLILLGYLILLRIKSEIFGVFFLRLLAIVILGISLPFVFLFFLFSKLH
jgi:hypothetical protein